MSALACKVDYRVRGLSLDTTKTMVLLSTVLLADIITTQHLHLHGTSWTTGDVIGVRYDEGDVYFYKNGTIMNASPILSLTGSWCPLFHTYDSGHGL